MLVTSPLARTALLLTLATLAAALMMVRVTVSQQKAEAGPASQTISFAGHTPGSAAHERHAYRLRLAAAAAASER